MRESRAWAVQRARQDGRGRKEEKVRGRLKGRGRAYIDAAGMVIGRGEPQRQREEPYYFESGKRYTVRGNWMPIDGRRWELAEERFNGAVSSAPLYCYQIRVVKEAVHHMFIKSLDFYGRYPNS